MLTNSPSFPDPASLPNTNSVDILLVHCRVKLAFSHTCKHAQTQSLTYKYKRANTGWGGWFQGNCCASLIAGQAMKEGEGPP